MRLELELLLDPGTYVLLIVVVEQSSLWTFLISVTMLQCPLTTGNATLCRLRL